MRCHKCMYARAEYLFLGDFVLVPLCLACKLFGVRGGFFPDKFRALLSYRKTPEPKAQPPRRVS